MPEKKDVADGSIPVFPDFTLTSQEDVAPTLAHAPILKSKSVARISLKSPQLRQALHFLSKDLVNTSIFEKLRLFCSDSFVNIVLIGYFSPSK